jgi:malonate transporter and related proteins
VFLFFRFALRFSLGESVLAALAASAPAVPFMGPAILGDLFGKASAISIAIAALVINLIVLPVTIFGLELGKTTIASTAHRSGFSEKLLGTFKEPMVWAPLLAFVLVLFDLKIPRILGHGLSLLSHASAGVALFASGIMLAAYKIKIDWIVSLLALLKNVVQPGLVLGSLLWFGYGGPVVAKAVLTTAIPTMPIVIVLAVQYQVAEAQASSTLFLSVVGSIVTMGVFIVLTQQVT